VALISPSRAPNPAPEEPRLKHVSVLGPRGFLRVAYVEWGAADAARTVLCLHGMTRNGRDFDVLGRELAHRGFRVASPDLPGRGRSEWLTCTIDYDTELYLSTMTALIARLGVDEVDWIGTSFGGYIGMEMAARKGSPIRRLVLNDFGARVPGAALRRFGSSSGRNLQFQTIEELESHLRKVLAPTGELTDAQWRHLAEHSALPLANGHLCLNHDPALTLPFLSPFLWPFLWPFMLDVPLWHTWDKIACPVLIVRGEDSDFLSADTVQEMQKRGVAAKLGLVQTAAFADCGHAPALMSKNQIDVVADFLVSEARR
jgi:pimeloyl-ACP methyl ester carboxylesterase